MTGYTPLEQLHLVAPWERLRLYVLRRDNWTCRYCGGPANSVDHVIPFSKGGPNITWNLVAACMPCNTRKGATRAAWQDSWLQRLEWYASDLEAALEESARIEAEIAEEEHL